MRVSVAILVGLAVFFCQVAHGGALVPFLMIPSLGIVFLALLAAVPAQFRTPAPPVHLILVGAALAVYSGWRCFVSPEEESARIDLGMILLYGGAWLAVAMAVTSRVSRYWLIGMLLLGGLIEAGFATIQSTQTDGSLIPFWFSEELRGLYFGRFVNRPRGLYLNPNQLAWAMNVTALLALGLGTWGRLRAVPRIVVLYLAGFFVVMTILTGSRGGILSLVVGVSVFAGTSLFAIGGLDRAHRLRAILTGVAAAAVGLGLLAFVFARNWVAQGRIDSLLDPDVRLALAEHAVRAFQQEPLTGIGAGQYRYYARLFREFGEHRDAIFAHSDWLQFLAEYGFVGIALVFVFLAFSFRAGWRNFSGSIEAAMRQRGRALSNRAGIAVGAVAASAACVAHSVFDFNLHIAANGLLAAVVFGLMAEPYRDAIHAGTGRFWLGGVGRSVAVVCVLASLGGFLFRYAASDYHGLIATNALMKGKAGLAIELAERGLTSRPDDPTLNFALGEGHLGYQASLRMRSIGDDSTEDLIIDGPEVELPGDDAGYAAAGELSEAEFVRRLGEAERFLGKAVEAQPRERLYRFALGGVLGESGKYRRAAAEMRRGIRWDPAHGSSWGVFAEMEESRDRLRSALRLYEIGAVLSGGEANLWAVEDLREEIASEQQDSE